MVELQTLKNDLVANSIKYDQLITKRNKTIDDIFRMEGVIGYIKLLIAYEEKQALIVKKEKKEIKKD